MRQLSKRLIVGLVGTLCFATVATALTLTVRYKPYGVPDNRREEYEEKVAQLKQRSDMLWELKDAAKPVAFVDKKAHDFGLLDPHTTAKHAFTIKNNGEHPLALEVRETSCKCTVGTLDNALLDPGQSTKVTMTWNTGYQADHYEQTATIVTNDPVQKSITLKVVGEVRAEFVTPELVEFQASDPAVLTEGRFVVYSQLWDDFTVSNVTCGLKGFDWHAEPLSTAAPELVDREAKSAWQIRVFAYSEDYGAFQDQLELTVQPSHSGEEVVREIKCTGRVRAPISFISPDIHKNEGLDIGTVVSNREHQFHLVVRVRGEQSGPIEVLDVQPETLRASLAPLGKPGNYRLTLTVPNGSPLEVFNAAEKHGYVQVGDPRNHDYSNWFPVYGAIVTVTN